MLGNFLRSNGKSRVFETLDGEEFTFIATRACQGDLGNWDQEFIAAEKRIAHIDNDLIYNDFASTLGAEHLRLNIGNDSFLDFEDALVTKINKVWNDSVDSGLKSFVAMMDDLNDNVTEEMIAQLIMPHLDEFVGEYFYTSPEVRKAIKKAVSRSWAGGKAITANQIGIGIPRSAYIDTKAQTWLRNDTRFWLRHRWEGTTRRKIEETAVKVGIEQGLGRREAGRAMAKAFKGICGENPYYWELVGSNAITRARTWSGKVTMNEAGIIESIWTALGDERMCRVCGGLDGTAINVKKAMKLMERSLETDDYLSARAITPSINYSSKRDKKGKPALYFNEYNKAGEIVKKRYFKESKLQDGKWLVENGIDGPQAHPG